MGMFLSCQSPTSEIWDVRPDDWTPDRSHTFKSLSPERLSTTPCPQGAVPKPVAPVNPPLPSATSQPWTEIPKLQLREVLSPPIVCAAPKALKSFIYGRAFNISNAQAAGCTEGARQSYAWAATSPPKAGAAKANSAGRRAKARTAASIIVRIGLLLLVSTHWSTTADNESIFDSQSSTDIPELETTTTTTKSPTKVASKAWCASAARQLVCGVRQPCQAQL